VRGLWITILCDNVLSAPIATDCFYGCFLLLKLWFASFILKILKGDRTQDPDARTVALTSNLPFPAFGTTGSESSEVAFSYHFYGPILGVTQQGGMRPTVTP
jgi:hypothetical protein